MTIREADRRAFDPALIRHDLRFPDLIRQTIRIVIDWGPAVARAHAELKRAGADWYVDNLDRTIGALVNGEGVEGVEEGLFADGDRVRVGDTVLIFRQPGIGPAREPCLRRDSRSRPI